MLHRHQNTAFKNCHFMFIGTFICNKLNFRLFFSKYCESIDFCRQFADCANRQTVPNRLSDTRIGHKVALFFTKRENLSPTFTCHVLLSWIF